MLCPTMTIQQWLDKCPAEELKEFEQEHCLGQSLFRGFQPTEPVMRAIVMRKIKIEEQFMLKYLDADGWPVWQPSADGK